MDKQKIDRINELARKKKLSGLTEDELAEQKILREEYILEIRSNVLGTLDNTYIEYPNGKKVKLEKKN